MGPSRAAGIWTSAAIWACRGISPLCPIPCAGWGWIVRARGLEPPWLAPHGPKPCACTNSATPAGQKEIYPRKMLPVSSLEVAPTIHDALAAGGAVVALESAVITHGLPKAAAMEAVARQWDACADRKSTRLNSSHANISYAVFCLKKKKRDIVIQYNCKL